jgi:glycosyltransferase involved in cell wall biosynthesis
MPRVSVIACVYNLEDVVLETVHSVLGQTYADFEFVINDDGSTDRTVEKIESVRDPRIRLIRSPHSGYPSAAYNVAAAHAVGEYLIITGADDVSLPRRIETQVRYLDEHTEVGVLHTAYLRLIDGRTLPADDLEIAPGKTARDRLLPQLLRQNFICTPSCALRRRDLDLSQGLFPFDSRILNAEDFDLWLRLAEREVAFSYLPDPLVSYRSRPGSLSRNRQRDLSCTVTVLHSALRRRPEIYKPCRSLVSARLAYLYRELAGCKFQSRTAGAWSDLVRSLTYAPLHWRTWSWGALGLLGAANIERILSARRGRSGNVADIVSGDLTNPSAPSRSGASTT